MYIYYNNVCTERSSCVKSKRKNTHQTYILSKNYIQTNIELHDVINTTQFTTVQSCSQYIYI